MKNLKINQLAADSLQEQRKQPALFARSKALDEVRR
jgi:hypothetical protein